MKKFGVLFSVAVLAIGAVGLAQDEPPVPLDLTITQVWARPAGVPIQQPDPESEEAEATPITEDELALFAEETSAIYFTVTNNDERNARLIGAATDAAQRVELHQRSGVDDNNIIQTRPLSGGVFIGAGRSVTLSPDAEQILLLGPDDLQSGDPFTVDLTFEALQADGTVTNEVTAITVGGVTQEKAPQLANNLRINAATIWARPADANGTSAVYMTIENPTDLDATLVSATTEVAGIVELHETAMGDNDVMMMRPVAGGITIPSAETRELRPGGFHVMLLDLPDDLIAGETIALTITFDDGSEIAVGAPIEDRMMGGMMNNMDMDMEGEG